MNTYVIAEIGINHNGSLENCLKLIDAAADAGCNAAKFQTFSAKKLYPKTAGSIDWEDDKGSYQYDIYDAVKSFELPLGWIEKLIEHCNSRGIDFISSVFDTTGLDVLTGAGMKIIKLSSYAITNIPLIEACAKTALPIIMSTGGASLAETEEAVNSVFKFHNKLTLLHCSIQYPTKLHDCNLGVIQTLHYAFPGLKIGYSDHTKEISEAPTQSIYLGANVVEKHITLDKTMNGPDHFFALEPQELKQMVEDIREAETKYQSGNYTIDEHMFGSSAKVCHVHEKYLRDFAFMTLFSNRKIEKGEQITTKDIAILRPGKNKPGLAPKYLSIFNKYDVVAKVDLAPGSPLDWDVLFSKKSSS